MWLKTILLGTCALLLANTASAQVFERAKPKVDCGADNECVATFPTANSAAQRLCGGGAATIVAWHRPKTASANNKKDADSYLVSCRNPSLAADDVSYVVSGQGNAMVALDYGKFLAKRLLPPPTVAGNVAAPASGASAIAGPTAISDTPPATVAGGESLAPLMAESSPTVSTDTGVMPLCKAVDSAQAKDSDFVMMQRVLRNRGQADCFVATFIQETAGKVQIVGPRGNIAPGDSGYFGPSVSAGARQDIRAMMRQLKKASF